MTFPTGTVISTTHLDSGDDDPSLARADIYAAVQALNQLIASENAALGVLVLDASGKVAASRLPNSYSVTGNVTLSPTTGVVNVNRVLRLQQTVTADLGTDTGTTSPTAGDMVYLTDGDAGTPCLGVYDGTQWRVVRLMMSAGSAQSALSTTVSLTATAVA